MKTVSFPVYTVHELKAQFPEAYARALEKHRDDCWSRTVPWQDEIRESVLALVKTSGFKVKDYSVGAYSPSHLTVEAGSNYETEQFTGRRAFAWLENALLSKLRLCNNRIDDWRTRIDPATGYFRKGYVLHKERRFYRTGDGGIFRRATYGGVPSCPFTGYFADDEFLSSLVASLKKGRTVKDALERLADDWRTMLENELDQERSEEGFLERCDCNETQFTEEGEVWS